MATLYANIVKHLSDVKDWVVLAIVFTVLILVSIWLIIVVLLGNLYDRLRQPTKNTRFF